MVVFLLLGVIWAAVLVPPWLQARREARPIASIMSFRSQLWSLQRATPTYGDTYEVYGDGVDHDEGDRGELAGVGVGVGVGVAAGAAVHSFGDARRTSGRVAPGVVGTVVRSAEDGAPHGLARRTTTAARRACAFRRRRQVLSLLFLLTAASTAPAVVVGGPWVVAAAVAGTLLVAYLSLLIRRGRREVERAQKVRYLTPIRAPRPSVVVFGSGAAR